ncbi:hypothetical protein HMPREF0178_01166 [Bilophila sp. 4_1_30]|uniref:ADP-ribosylglycohydrolase family protein n=1 Tax=Bilophila sp. 4_1_30 TaxID=693988 RepID=UPI0002237E0A|nr:ADP-ribosylglycohydrolase family protein [Bilophila sp. 4_1_30]EGW42065.1 hypothetical protein HMPREF0178_01166 [Bilophila sp. 4_1_30]
MRTSTLMLLTWLKTMENKELKAIIQAVTDEQKIRKGESHRREALFKEKALLKDGKKLFLKQSQLVDKWLEQYSVNAENPLEDEKRLDELANEWNIWVNSFKDLIGNGITETCYTDGQTEKDVLEHVQGCLLGMVAGAWLNAITREYSPSEKAFSSLVWNIPFTWAPDDGIELALALANSLIKEKMFKPEAVYYAYLTWMLSRPFKENRPILAGIGEKTSTLLRTAVLACFGRNCELTQVIHWCALNVKITHPDPVCVFTNEIYAVAVFFALKSGNPEELYEKTIEWGFKSENQEKTVLEALLRASTSPPNVPSQGAICSLQNAFYQLLHAKTLTEGILSRVEDTFPVDRAICGALLGATYGEKAFPEEWKKVLQSSPLGEKRPPDYQPHNIFLIAEKLIVSCI